MIEFGSIRRVKIAQKVYHYSLRLMPWLAAEEQGNQQ
jgi:hypothetical protein